MEKITPQNNFFEEGRLAIQQLTQQQNAVHQLLVSLQNTIQQQNELIKNQQQAVTQLTTMLTKLMDRMEAMDKELKKPTSKISHAPERKSDDFTPIGANTSSWATVAASPPVQIVTNQTKKKIINKKKHVPANIIRYFSPPSTSASSYSIVYISTKYRQTIREDRLALRQLGITTNRILDITQPTRGVLGLLVHEEYQSQLEQQLFKLKIEVKKDFDPTSADVIQDPKLHHLSQIEKETKARQIFNTKCVRSLKNMRSPTIRNSISRDYVKKN